MKYWYQQYIFMFLALMATANCIRHLIRLGAWESFALILLKDLAVVIFVTYLFRLSRAIEERNLRNLAVRSMHTLLTVSFVGDAAVMLLK